MSRQFLNLCTVLVVLFVAAPAVSANEKDAEAETVRFVHKLKGRTIRSLAVHPKTPPRFLVGIKSKRKGGALLFESRDAGKTWVGLNGGKSLSPEATDVQAVAYSPDDPKRVLAGTWQHGLYSSKDGGKTFQLVKGLPTKDIRSIKFALNKPNVAFVGTGGLGVLRSTDGGEKWERVSKAIRFVWSVVVSDDGSTVWAQTFEKACFRSVDGGKTWTKVFKKQNCMHVAVHPKRHSLVFLATGDMGTGKGGLFSSKSGGADWKACAGLPDVAFTSLAVSAQTSYRVFAGTLGKGLFAFDSKKEKWSQLDVAPLASSNVSHIRLTEKNLIVGTWGNGIVTIQLEG